MNIKVIIIKHAYIASCYSITQTCNLQFTNRLFMSTIGVLIGNCIKCWQFVVSMNRNCQRRHVSILGLANYIIRNQPEWPEPDAILYEDVNMIVKMQTKNVFGGGKQAVKSIYVMEDKRKWHEGFQSVRWWPLKGICLVDYSSKEDQSILIAVSYIKYKQTSVNTKCPDNLNRRLFVTIWWSKQRSIQNIQTFLVDTCLFFPFTNNTIIWQNTNIVLFHSLYAIIIYRYIYQYVYSMFNLLKTDKI